MIDEADDDEADDEEEYDLKPGETHPGGYLMEDIFSAPIDGEGIDGDILIERPPTTDEPQKPAPEKP